MWKLAHSLRSCGAPILLYSFFQNRWSVFTQKMRVTYTFGQVTLLLHRSFTLYKRECQNGSSACSSGPSIPNGRGTSPVNFQ